MSQEFTFNQDALVARVNSRREQEEKLLLTIHPAGDSQKFKPILTQLFNYGSLKRILFNHCSTYKLLVNDHDYMEFHKEGKCRDMKELCSSLQVPMPCFDIRDAVEKIYIYSEFVAIPYLILDSETMDPNHKREVVIVFHDMFDNMYESFKYYSDTLKGKTNKRIVLFNFPGQAYTIYQREVSYTNEYLSTFVDSFFYHLEAKGYLDFMADRIKFIGIGYGGNILLYYSSLP